MTSTILTEADLAQLVTDLVLAGTRVIAPAPAGPDVEDTEYRPVERLEEAVLDGPLPRRSLKEFLRPAPDDGLGATGRQVILGARPCDAAGIETLDRVMALEYRDDLWRARRLATTVVTVACDRVERSCFCGAVGSGPDSTRGADAILVPLEAGDRPPRSRARLAAQLRRCVDLFLLDSEPFAGAAGLQAADAAAPPRLATRWVARAVTLRGATLLRGRGVPLVEAADRERAGAFARAARDQVAANLEALRLRRRPARLGREAEARLGLMAADGGELVEEASPLVGEVPGWLAEHHDHELWKTLGDRCRSCGNCSAVCSTSPCFDLDERDADRAGAGRPAARAWAGAARPPRREHLRQRLVHKFSIHPRRFGEVLCTGCGRCSRSCEGGVQLPEILGGLVQLAVPVPVRAAT